MSVFSPLCLVVFLVITSPEGRKSMLKLAERMVMSFCAGVGASTAHTWTTLSGSGADDVRVMTRKSMDDPGRPPGIVLSAATSFWIPVPPKRVFDFLRDENSRSEVLHISESFITFHIVGSILLKSVYLFLHIRVPLCSTHSRLLFSYLKRFVLN